MPPDTQLPPDGVLKIRTESNRGKRNACLTAMSQKLMCDKEITILQIATNYSKLPTRDLAGNSTYILILNCWFSRFLSLSKAKKNSMGVQEKEQL